MITEAEEAHQPLEETGGEVYFIFYFSFPKEWG